VRDRAGLTLLFERDRPELTGLINNAGLALGRGPIQDGDPNDWDTMMDTNVRALLWVTKLALPALMRTRGHIVNIGSVAGHLVYPGGNIYCATKHAVRALNQALRADLLGSGVRVTEVSPGMVETEFSEVRFQGDLKKARAVYAGMTPLKPEDVAEAVLWTLERPAHVNIEEIVIYPTDQASPTQIHRSS
jgi:serine 3-dehydrogenase